MQSDEALTLGRLRADLPDTVEVILKRELNGATPPHVIARTSDYLHFAEHAAAFMLLDHDGKGIPQQVAAKLKELGGFWSAVTNAVPALAAAARVSRRSTSAGLYDTSTGKRFAGSNNEHDYVAVADGTDIERALKTLHRTLMARRSRLLRRRRCRLATRPFDHRRGRLRRRAAGVRRARRSSSRHLPKMRR